MNAVVNDDSTDLEATLSTARARLEETTAREAKAAEKHAADAEALTYGQSRLAEAQAEVARLASLDDEAVHRHAQRLEHQAREGKSGPLPTLVPSDKHLQAQIIASRTLAAAVQMIANLEQTAQRSAQELAMAKSAQLAAAKAVTFAEREIFAEKVLCPVAEALEAGVWLKRYVPSDFNITIGTTLIFSPRVQRALDVLKRLKAPTLQEELNMPLPKLKQQQLPQESNFMEVRRDALIAEAGATDARAREDAA